MAVWFFVTSSSLINFEVMKWMDQNYYDKAIQIKYRRANW